MKSAKTQDMTTGEMSLFFAEPLAWLGADVVMLVGYFVI